MCIRDSRVVNGHKDRLGPLADQLLGRHLHLARGGHGALHIGDALFLQDGLGFGDGGDVYKRQGKDGAPEGELITLMDYQAALEPMVDTLRRRGVKVFAGLLLPREINHIYTEQREGLRLAINHWLAGCGLFDAVLDLGAPIAAPDGPGMKKEYALPDGLHPNKLGGQKIAQGIDLGLFAPGGDRS